MAKNKPTTMILDPALIERAKRKCARDGYVLNRVINILLHRWADNEIQTVGDEKDRLFNPKEAETIQQAIIAYSPHQKVINKIAKKLELQSTWRK